MPQQLCGLSCQFRLTDHACQPRLTGVNIEELSESLSSDDPAVGLRASLALHRLAERVEANQVAAARDLESGTDAPALPMRAVPKKPRIRDVAKKDRFRMTPAAKKVLEEASKPNRRRLYVTAPQVLAQILALEPPDPAAVLLGALGVNPSDALHELASTVAEPDQTEGRR